MKLQLTDDQKLRHEIIDGPVFKDGCEHSPDCYVCTFRVLEIRSGNYSYVNYDLYLFPQSFQGTEVCIRYGDKPEEYISPGGLGEFMNTAGIHWADMVHYQRASLILRNFGCFAWTPRVKEEVAV